MAKLSFDYAKLVVHPRFKALARRLGEEGRALNCVCRFWSIAQEYWGDGRRCIPTKIFDLDEEFAALVDTDFAERREGGVYAKGAQEFFEWYANKREAAAKGGVASAESRKKKYGSAQPQNLPHFPEADAEAPSKQDRSTLEADAEALSKHLEVSGSKHPNPSISTSISVSTSSSVPASEEAGINTLSTVSTTRKPRKVPTLTFSEPDLAVGRAWLAYALSEMPWKEDDPKWTPEHFADAIAKVRRATDLNETGMAELLRFVAKDEFWRKNACSPSGLLKRSSRNGERKIDNILVRLRTKEQRTSDAMQQWAMEGETNDQA